jgi:pyruvate carboxylase subunit B
MDNEKLETFRVYIAEYQTKLTKKFRERKQWTRPNPNHVLAVIPGTILEIMVKKNQKVKEGEILLILEAMKMENRVTMPFDGIVKSINVVNGETVAKKHIMIEIAPD